jgi:hypothetical protein
VSARARQPRDAEAEIALTQRELTNGKSYHFRARLRIWKFDHDQDN